MPFAVTNQVVAETTPPEFLKKPEISIEDYAQRVAEGLPAATVRAGKLYTTLQRLDALRTAIHTVHRRFAQDLKVNGTASYAREWLLDNPHVYQNALLQVEQGLPPRYYAELPKLTAGVSAGLPRIYAAARAFATFTEGRVAEATARSFLISFQEVRPLTMGELWAWPLMLRLCALENLVWALEQTTGSAEFSRYLWDELRAQLTRQHPTPQLLVATSITALRNLDTYDWQEFFESVSRVEALLQRDPAGVYAQMDFDTRNHYRRVIENVASEIELDEETIARTALEIAQKARESAPAPTMDSALDARREAHVGFYLIDAGYPVLRRVLGQPKWRDPQPLRRALYFGGIGLVTLLTIGIVILFAAAHTRALTPLVIVGLLALIPASSVATYVVNWLAALWVKPSRLPKLDFSEGIPTAFRTAVVIPALLTDEESIESLLAQLERHSLRNTDPNLRFVLLADFADAPEQTMPEDKRLLERAGAGITALNTRYSTPTHQPFYLLVRRRLWNESEQNWMGYERKRGKLAEFNRLLLHPEAETTFILKHGNMPALAGTRYVITLDADTILPHGAAHRLVGTLAHPLNRARFDSGGQQVTAGYTVLQPRVELLPNVGDHTLFAYIMGGDTGFDLYTLAVSDVYQDLFGEGNYIGKGIYDVAAFERTLAGRIPDNTLLSHDLFEGVQGRAGLVTDIVLVEDYPTHYLAYTRRLHRWIRGDWQLLPWLLPMVPHASGKRVPNSLSALGYWKFLDNLRRSLERPALLLLLLAGWLILPGSPFFWTAFVLLVLLIPYALGVFMLASAALRRKTTEVATVRETRYALLLLRWVLVLAFMPYEALLALDAIARTLYRLVRRRHLLEWTAAARVMRLVEGQTGLAIWRQMLSALVLTALVALAILLTRPATTVPAAPILILWIIAPYLAERLSMPHRREKPYVASAEDTRQLRMLARRTWLFFEAFVGAESHWLPPDNFQSEPREVVKLYTSSTNIGLTLLSTLGAYDLGYIGILDLLLRHRFAFDTLNQLERYRGHLLNWYHTQTLEPLPPRYVSTVDSGNYAGCLVALQGGYRALGDVAALRDERWQGALDILDILQEMLDQLSTRKVSDTLNAVAGVFVEMRERIDAIRPDPWRWSAELQRLMNEVWAALITALNALTTALGGQHARLTSDVHLYLSRLHHHFFSMQRDIESLLPWLILFPSVPPGVLEYGEGWRALQDAVMPAPRLRDLPEVYSAAQKALKMLEAGIRPDDDNARAWCGTLSVALEASAGIVRDLLENFVTIQRQLEKEFDELDFRFLYNPERNLFHIGYNIEREQPDNSYYDLLASEARLASYIAIAKGDVPYKHWIQLGRPMRVLPNGQVLYSWSGTMFEYLMPLLLMRQETNTLLSSSMFGSVDIQIAYARQRSTPWGISESGFNAMDLAENYQYRAFGVPDLALKRGQELDHVVAPYASLLALPLCPAQVMENLEYLIRIGALDTFGLIEAVDFTTPRLPTGRNHALVNEYMAHHQGMIFLSLTNFLRDNIMVRRFHADSRIQSVELLLLEQIPAQVSEQEEVPEDTRPDSHETNAATVPWEVPTRASVPQAHFLSNGRYAVIITSAGAGYSQWGDYALTRWRADTTLDAWGTWLYIFDHDSGKLSSAAYQPMDGNPERLQTTFYPHKAEFIRRDGDLTSFLEVVVPPENDLEIRRLTLTNHSDRRRRLTVSSYAEMVMSSQGNDQRHQAFNKMFIESEYVGDAQALVFRRRLRSAHESPLYVLHRVVTRGELLPPQYETDRARFLGRNRDVRTPAALSGAPLRFSRTTGSTLDPIMSLAQDIEIRPRGTAQIVFLTMAGEDRAEILNQARVFGNWERIGHAFDQARYQAERDLQNAGPDATLQRQIQGLFSSLLYPNPKLRALPNVLAANTQAQPALWANGISGEYPIILLEVMGQSELGLVRDLVIAHAYWRNRGVKSTLVILNMLDAGYAQSLYEQLHNLISRLRSETLLNRHDGIFILRNEQFDDPARILLRAAARITLNTQDGTLEEQLARREYNPVNPPPFIPTLSLSEVNESDQPLSRPADLQFDNGYGGFTADGREYVIMVAPKQRPPAPWINVVANEKGGFLVSESGGGYTWAFNASENRLSAWRNDPVVDVPGEAIYLRDEETGAVWSPTPMPAGTDKPYRVTHGAGYTIFEHHSHGLEQTTRLAMAPDDPVKLVRIRLKNRAPRPRRITVTFYVEWVLGPTRDITQQFIIPAFDADAQILTARNPYSSEFGGNVAFLAASKAFHGLTTDRTEFLGRMGSYSIPAGLLRLGLSGTIRAGVDPCAVVQLHVDLPVDGEEEVCFLLGQGIDRASALELGRKYRETSAIEEAWNTSRAQWRERLDSIVVRTPDAALNIILPWLLYQALSCRIWGRTALYQSSGAYGFRDQLQDVLSLTHTRPDLTREHILRASRHQFEAGDVLHWWHPPAGRGVRTRFSDDLVWLPYVVAHYVSATGDYAILEEKVPFLTGEPLRPDEEDRFGLYESTAESYSIYEHCRRALDKAYLIGEHGLVLMRAGDWNDGMNRVGIEGRGESVWMAWFLHVAMDKFLPLCERAGDTEAAERYRSRMAGLRDAVQLNAWDGAWYLRAFYDDGTPLGSAANDECQIDSLPQSWAVLAGMEHAGRVEQAMKSVEERLVREQEQMILLFTPPFNHTEHDPGYIKGYPPGIRENGGQYTHAAIWVVWAVAEMGRGQRATELFGLINPIHHADTRAKADVYRVEPYVVAADIYSTAPHTGRGGWTWYTGSSGWMYRLGVEAILGLQREGQALRLEPKISRNWQQFEIDYRCGGSVYHIRYENPNGVEAGVSSVTLDGEKLPSNLVPLTDDGKSHEVLVVLG